MPRWPPTHDLSIVAPLRLLTSLALRHLRTAAARTSTACSTVTHRAGQRGNRRSTGPYPRTTSGPVGAAGTTVTTPHLDVTRSANVRARLTKTIDKEVISGVDEDPVVGTPRPSTARVIENSGLGVRIRRNTHEPAIELPGVGSGESDIARRRYITRVMQQRIHQARFRASVLLAYRVRCTICRLHDHPELLDAAHILPDGHPRGEPVVPNGLALCKLHHAAFDANLMGVRPDHVIEVKRRLLGEIDGPMLVHGLQGFDRQTITVPRRTELRPNREFLEERYELFRAAG
jgi:hypothetical protein